MMSLGRRLTKILLQRICQIKNSPDKSLKKPPETVYNITDHKYSLPFNTDQTMSVFKSVKISQRGSIMEEQLNMMRRGRQFKQLMNKKMDGIIREYDVKRVEIEILRFLAMSGERNTAADIHRYLDLNKGQISKTLEHLCTMHYLESMPDKKDRRYMHYILSEEAKELVRRINAIWDDMHQQIMSGIQAEDRAIFNKVLNHAMANMERMIDEASV